MQEVEEGEARGSDASGVKCSRCTKGGTLRLPARQKSTV
jgi:hypothetical protein